MSEYASAADLANRQAVAVRSPCRRLTGRHLSLRLLGVLLLDYAPKVKWKNRLSELRYISGAGRPEPFVPTSVITDGQIFPGIRTVYSAVFVTR